MRRYLQSSRGGKPQGMALVVAMLVIVLLTGIGVIALNAATYDVASAGAVRQEEDAVAVAQAGLVIGRCEMCEGIDGMVSAMQKQQLGGIAPQFKMTGGMLEGGLANGEKIFRPGGAAGVDPERDSFGHIYLADGVNATKTDIDVVVDRARESGNVAGFSLVESVGSDSASFCFRNYRVTSTGIYMPMGAAQGTQSQHRAFITAGPIQCTN